MEKLTYIPPTLELFKEHPTHKGIWVGNCGTILSTRKGSGRHMNPYGAEPHPLKVSIMNSGYLHCSVGTIHSLVAKVWLPNPYNLPCVNHKDENKTNNVVALNDDLSVNIELSNLEWCSYKYNSQYSKKPMSNTHKAKIAASNRIAQKGNKNAKGGKSNRGQHWYKDSLTGEHIYYTI